MKRIFNIHFLESVPVQWNSKDAAIGKRSAIEANCVGKLSKYFGIKKSSMSIFRIKSADSL
jgi:hypothetical protein